MQTSLMIQANNLNPQIFNLFTFVFLLVFWGPRQLDLALIFPKYQSMFWEGETMNPSQEQVSISVMFLPLLSVGKKKNPTSMFTFHWSWSQYFMISVPFGVHEKIISATKWCREMGRSGQSHLAAMKPSGGLLDPNGPRSACLIGSKWPSHAV